MDLKSSIAEQGAKADYSKDNLPDWFCPVPFSTLIFNPWGNVGGCRELGNEHHLGDIRDQSWEEIWNGEKARAWRREFLTGNIKTCAENICHRKCHKEIWNNDLIADLELSEIQTKPPQRISPDFNGQCNLRCEMCKIWMLPNGLYDEVDFWEGAEKNLFPFLTQVDPLAGEPLIQKDTFRLMEIMGRKNPQAAWRITTNGHWKFSKFLKEKLDKIRIAGINVSLDAVSPEVYEECRKEGKVEVVLKAIDDLTVYREVRRTRDNRDDKPFGFNINMTVHKKNWREMGDLVKLSLAKGAVPLVQLLYRPDYLSLLSLPESEQQEIVDYYFDTLDWEILKYCRRPVYALLESLPKTEQTISRMEMFTNVGTCAQLLETEPKPKQSNLLETELPKAKPRSASLQTLFDFFR